MIFSSKDYDSERYAVDIGVFHPPGLQQRKSPSHSWSVVQDPTEFKSFLLDTFLAFYNFGTNQMKSLDEYIIMALFALALKRVYFLAFLCLI